MRSLLLTMTVGAGLGLIFLTFPVNAITITTPAGVRSAADALDLSEAVHCRKYSHRHKRGHGWSRGCRAKAKAAIVTPRSGMGTGSTITRPGTIAPSPPPGVNPSNRQDLPGRSNPQDMTQPRAINPQDLRPR